MKLGLAKILENASKLPTKAEKIEYLQQNDNHALRLLLRMAHDKNLKWALPEGAPPYKESQLDDCEGILYNEIRRLYLFHEGGNPDLKQIRREILFQQLLETLDKDDAKLLLGVKEKKLPYKGLTPKIIEEAYPGLLQY